MYIIYTVLAAIVGMALVVIVDMGITKIFDKKSFSKKIILRYHFLISLGFLFFFWLWDWFFHKEIEL